MHNILQKIIEKKLTELVDQKVSIDEKELETVAASVVKGHVFKDAIEQSKKDPALIAEIKLASPTKLFFDDASDITKRAKAYEKAQVDAISVVVEKHFFKGDPKFVTQIKKEVTAPILMKDFVIDPFQIYEAKKTGADALLLIAKLVKKERLQEFVALCLALGIEPVVEIHDISDLDKALSSGSSMIAVNARDLETFVVDVEGACELLAVIPPEFTKLGFSGIGSSKEVEMYKDAGARGVLVGTALMEAENIQEFIQELYER